MSRKIIWLTALVLAGVFWIFSAGASAELKTYTGVGKYYMSETETLADAQSKAALLAEQNALEQALVFVRSNSKVKNFKLTDDEIVLITAGILYVKDTRYSIEEDFDGVLIVKAEITVEIDEDKISELVEREKEAHS